MKEMEIKHHSKKGIGILIYISLELFVSIGGIGISVHGIYQNIAVYKYLLILFSILLIFSIILIIFKNRIWKNQ
ncbi:hypothetical protein [Ferroplasma acidiphilum]|uniref:hypothetical protein n=1 Tax=Ferroplasma acidiphilum TaxID=74969 RepID=UPI0023F2FED9|nr:hypothetical protein [Ferroplasma acidiphilum]